MIFKVIWKEDHKDDPQVFIKAANAARAVLVLHRNLRDRLDQVEGLSRVIFKDGVAKVEEEILCY